MIDELILDTLNELLDVPVYPEIPEHTEGEYVILNLVKGTNRHGLAEMSVICDSYSGSMYSATQLNDKVERALESLICFNWIRDITRNSSYPANDTARKVYRYKCNYDCYYYEV